MTNDAIEFLDLTRVPPHSTASEQIVVGCAVFSPAALDEADFLKPDDFHEPVHRILWQAMTDLIANGQVYDVVALHQQLSADAYYLSAGGIKYLWQLEQPSRHLIGLHSQKVLALARQRRLILAIGDAYRNAWADDADESTVLGDLLTAVGGETEVLSTIKTMPEIVDLLLAYHSTKQHQPGPRLPWPTVDRHIGELQPGQLIVVAGRSSVGKTSAAAQLAAASDSQGFATLFFSLEMTHLEMGHRILSADAGIDANSRRVTFSAEEQDAIHDGFARMRTRKMLVDDGTDIGLAEISARCRRIARSTGLGLVVVDHLDLLRRPKAENQTAALDSLVRGCKVLAKQLSVPIVLCHQLSKTVGRNDEDPPTLADLRGTAAVEHNANVVILLHRPHFKAPSSAERSESQIILAKNRDGAVGIVPARYIEATKTFEE